MIYDIIGEDSPVIQGLRIPESGRANISYLADDEELPATLNSNLGIVVPPRKKRRVELSELLELKRKKQLELLDLEIYKRKLECLKLERELDVQKSTFTQSLPLLQDIFAEVHDIMNDL